ncbi:MAG: hypothetical protein ACT4RN_19530 [Pseudonocardia sp.]
MALSMSTLERMVRALQGRLDDLEGAHEQTLYRMERRLTRTELTLNKMATQMGVVPATDDEVDAAMDER